MKLLRATVEVAGPDPIATLGEHTNPPASGVAFRAVGDERTLYVDGVAVGHVIGHPRVTAGPEPIFTDSVEPVDFVGGYVTILDAILELPHA